MALSSSEADLDTSPAWRCTHNNRLHRHDSTCTADTPLSDLIPDTPGRLSRFQEKTGTGLGSSQASQTTPTKFGLRPQQSATSSRAARMARTLSPPIMLDSSSQQVARQPSPGLFMSDEEDVPPPPACPYTATTDHEVPVPYMASSPPLLNQRNLQSIDEDISAAYMPSSPPLLSRKSPQPTIEDLHSPPLQPQRSTFGGLLDRFSRSRTPARGLPSSSPFYNPASPRISIPELTAQRQVNGILLTRLSGQDARLARLQTRNDVLNTTNEAQTKQIRVVTAQRDTARGQAEVERVRGQVLTAGWMATVIGGGLYCCYHWISGVEFEYIEKRRREWYGM